MTKKFYNSWLRSLGREHSHVRMVVKENIILAVIFYIGVLYIIK